jgi:hypothetical protein
VQLIRERGLVVIEQPRTRHRVAFRFDSRRALERFLARVTGQPDASALEVAWQYVREGRAAAADAEVC